MSTCEHHKTCGDCHSPAAVRDLQLSARYLANHMAEATEYNLATLESLQLVKKSSKSGVARQQSICLKMLFVCGAEWKHVDLPQTKAYRVRKILEQTDGHNVQEKFEKWLEKQAL